MTIASPEHELFQKQTGMRRVILATGHSLRGLKAAYVGEAAFRQEVMLAAFAVPLALYLGEGALDRILLIGAVALVLIVELLNSAVEAVVDRVGSEYHVLSGQAKDMGSAAVFVSLGLAAYIWAEVLLF